MPNPRKIIISLIEEALRLQGLTPDWQELRSQILAQAAWWLWLEQPAASAREPALLSKIQADWQYRLARNLASHFAQVFARQNLWQKLSTLIALAESLAPPEIRRQQGIYYTPPEVVKFVVRHSLQYTLDPHSPQIFLDPACGGGLFLLGVIEELYQRLSADPQRQSVLLYRWIESVTGFDTDQLALQTAEFCFSLLWLSLYPKEPAPSPALFCLDPLASTATQQLALFEHQPQLSSQLRQNLGLFISNPPYLGERNNRQLFAELKQGHWARDYRGRGDLYYFFFYLALELAQPGLVCSLLTPSYFRSATAAQHLRQRLRDECQFLELTDFGELRLFPSANGHHSFLSIFGFGQPPGAEARTYRSQQKGQLRSGSLTEIEAGCQLVATPDLFQGSELILNWQPQDNLQAALRQLEQAAGKLGEVFCVRQGIVSGADSLSPAQAHRHQLATPPGSGIFVLNSQEAQHLSSQLTTAEQTRWLVPWSKNSELQPWKLQAAQRWLVYSSRQQTEPPAALLEHLQPFRAILSQRREVVLGRIQWWQLQWPREPEMFLQPKLMLPQRAKKGLAAYSARPAYASADVYYILAETPGWDLLALCALLNSPLYTCWWYHRGKRKGNLIELYYQPLTLTPLPSKSLLNRLRPLSQEILQKGWSEDLMPELHQQACQLLGLDQVLSQAVWDAYQVLIAS